MRRSALALALWLTAACLGCGRGASAIDLEGAPVDPLAQGAAVSVLVFVTRECPVSNRYAPEIQRLAARLAPRGVRFWLVYPSALDDAAAIRKHLVQYGYALPALRDPAGALVKRARAERTPEAAVFDHAGVLQYAGRIDDRFVSYGQERPTPTSHELEAALAAVLRGEKPSPARTAAVGCSIVQR